jgi:predicted nucleotidyltransferase
METQLPQDFKEFLKLLNEKRVEYLLIGGYAVGYHGYPRATNDLDIWIAISSDNARNIVAALQEFGFNLPELKADLFLAPESIVRMGVPPMRIEILTSVSGIEFDESYPHRIVDMLDGIEVNLISLDMLKRNKLASGRYKDLDDLEHLP